MGKIPSDLPGGARLAYIPVDRGGRETERFGPSVRFVELRITVGCRKMSSILPDEAHFSDFRRQCISMDNWVNKYDSDGMEVWVEMPPKNKHKNGPKIHKIKVVFFY